jgi:hypothetical protein
VDETPWTFSVREELKRGWTPWSPASAPLAHVSIVIVAGQSNATGWESTAVDPDTRRDILAETASPADEVQKLSWDQPKAISPAIAGLGSSGPVALLSPQILNDPDGPIPLGSQIFGPEISLARRLFDAGQRDVVVLKVAEGGSQLGGDGGWDPKGGSLYAALLSSTKELEGYEAAHGRMATVADINWIQGEADAINGEAASYEENLRVFISSLRHQLPTSPTTPVIVAKTSITEAIASWKAMGFCTPSKCAKLRAANAKVRAADGAVAESMPSVSLVETADLERHGMKLHLGATGELVLGERLAEAGLKAGLT